MKKYIDNIEREWEIDPFSKELSEAVDLIGVNSKKALDLLNSLADRGSALSMVYMGDTYGNARGVEQCIDIAIKFYRKAAKIGSIEGTFRLSRELWYQNKNDESIILLKKLSESGFSPASFLLGSIYFDGNQVIKNEQEAVRYFQLAESNGHLLAKRRLSIYLRSGAQGMMGRIKGYAKLVRMLPEFLSVSMKNPSSERLSGWHSYSKLRNRGDHN